MKMVKSLLLGTAAGLVAIAGAQAADLPVKAKPVQYVKICSLYGAGFYYIPGTDMCLKVGGWVRAEYAYGMNGSLGGPTVNGDVNNRTTNNSMMRARGYITADARNQSEYGTIRSYIAVGVSGTDVNGSVPATLGTALPGSVFDANRAFIQFAGFTFGKAQSFYDFYNFPATGYIPDFYSDTGDSGWMVFSYTAQLGNGLSATIGAEMRRSGQIIGSTSTGAAISNSIVAAGNPAAPSLVGGTSFAIPPGYGGFQVPDVVGNLRIDQAWGSAQVMGAAHLVNAAYDGNGAAVTVNSLENTGHPSDKWGFAFGAGLKLNAPVFGAGDYFQGQVNYTQGALKYAWISGNTNPYIQHGTGAAYGVNSDAVFLTPTGVTNTGLNLTTAWGVNAAYEHFWNPRWRTSLHGGYIAASYNSQANGILCQMEGNSTGSGALGTLAAGPGCGNNWNAWSVGTRTQWNMTPDTYLGLDVAYTQVGTANAGVVVGANGNLLPTALAGGAATVAPATTICSVTPAIAANSCTAATEGVWSVRFRVHRDFYP